ncbi:EFR1 family ferrodoxin [Desulfovibrio sp. JC022]|uniref:EFR1 family ferrodoxin n=1 Tax=Desulfovibrio sp. JC022 TaxID=2593642 RepID=UPI0013D0D827|nr:EFR1 family ferrodoxin [Desulfovibrio sp. JC022]NDV21316.1 4Fe-4S dicluster domain-containing protein [Desulfovibrio sp. JC022]
MKIKSAKLACFSPTGTTEKVIQAIATGIGVEDSDLVDITKPALRDQPFEIFKDELLVIGVPVYMGRVPGLLQGWFGKIKTHGNPVVCVVVYGNRVYDDALLELKNIMQQQGAVPVACAAYIGEHSFSNEEIPTAQDRPDPSDLKHAEMFGIDIREKLDSIAELSETNVPDVPGEFPYRGITELWNVDFIAVSDTCVQCGLCVDICPTGAIDDEDSAAIDQVKCITCCACLKKCPQQARTMKDSPVKDARKRLNKLFAEPKKPELFL